MKLRHYLPLVIFILSAAGAAAVFIGRDPFTLAGFGSFLFGFAITYFSCIRETRRNSHAVLRLNKRTPLILPFIFFSVPTLFFGLLMTAGSRGRMFSFLAMYAYSGLAYASGGLILVRDLKKNDRSRLAARAPAATKRRKLVLINPVNPAQAGLSVNRSSRFPPLGLGIIAALTPDDYQVVLKDEVMEPFSFEEADLVGITAFTSSIGRAYEIAAQYRQRGIPVVLGGIHASMCPEEASLFVDSVVVGEAESVWRDLLTDFEAGGLRPRYQGLPADLAGAPIARRDLFSHEYLFATIQTSRGCPMDCSFCSVTAFNGRTYRQRPVAHVLDELAGVEQSFLFFVDDNILGHGKEAEARAIALFKGMVDRKLTKSWFCQASLNFADNEEVLYWAAKSGCKMVFIGLESTDADELKLMKKEINLRRRYSDVFKRIHAHGIAVLGAFIFGSDAETAQSMKHKTRFMLRKPVDVLQTTILTPLPGTRLYRQYRDEGRLLYPPEPRFWEHFDMSELTFHPKLMNAELFRKNLEKCQSRIYSMPSLVLKFIQTLLTTGRLEAAFWAYNSNMNYRGVARAPRKATG